MPIRRVGPAERMLLVQHGHHILIIIRSETINLNVGKKNIFRLQIQPEKTILKKKPIQVNYI